MKAWIGILRRRILSTSAIAVLILGAGVSAAFLIPASYRSTATVLVEQEELSQEVTGTTKSAYAGRRIQILSKRVLSSSNLTKIAKEFDLFEAADYQDGKLPKSIIDGLRQKIDVETVNAEVIDSKMRFQVSAAIAFNVSFVAADPLTAQLVAERLVQMFFDENNALLLRGSVAAADLLREEEVQLAHKVEEAAERLRLFKEKNVYSLPDMKNTNILGVEKINDQITSARQQLKALHEQRIYLESELVRLSPNSIVYDADGGRVLGHEDRLKSLRADYASKKAKYSPSHPDLMNLSREIASLESELETDAEKEIEAELTNLRAELAGIKSRYSDHHPTVKSLNGRIAELNDQLQKEKGRALPSSIRNLKADNPAYITAASKLKSADLEIETLGKSLVELNEERRTYEDRLEKSPLVDQEYLQLERVYDQELEEYQTIRNKRFAAQLAESIEKNNTSQGLRVIEEADYPENPHKPNRKLLVFAALVLSVWGGIGTALVLEFYDERIWTVDDIVKELSEQPLSVIPTMRLKVPKSAKREEPMAKVAI